MARSGINKAHVMQAHAALIAKGVNPSIDALRTELGNTGSRSTIHRYLREIEDERGVRLDDEALLSATLREMVGRLAAQLREEARLPLELATDEHARLSAFWDGREAHLESQIAELQRLGARADGELEKAQVYNLNIEELLQKERIESQRHQQQVIGLQERLAENEKHWQSLEDKHQHARESLEHYRQSVKEQREQDERRHEQQIQQLQSELRQLQQSLIVKQNDITQLSTDNARLSSESGALQKHLSVLRVDYQVSQDAAIAWRDKSTQLDTQLQASVQHQKGLRDELSEAKQQLQLESNRHQQSELALAKAEMQVASLNHNIQVLQSRLSQETSNISGAELT